jgi:MFS transporter, DHA1 family, multidrug resistance protein
MSTLAPPIAQPVGREFVAILTGCTTLAALAIGTVLPAFDDMRDHFGLVKGASSVSWIVLIFLLGMATGGLIFGTVSDRFGRKPTLLAGLALYVLAGVVAAMAPSLATLLIARFVWGVGAAAPRAVSLAMIRDVYSGEAMARVMSMMMAAFMIVPVLAPALGQALNSVGPWQLVFWAPTIGGALVTVWVVLRLPETLPAERRRSISPTMLWDATKVVGRSRVTVLLTIGTTFYFGLLAAYLGGLENIVGKVFNHQSWFSYLFGGVSLVMMAATYVNARMVTGRGLATMIRSAAMVIAGAGLLLAVVSTLNGGRPAFGLLCALLGIIMASQNTLFPNASTAAMTPLGEVAGLAASVIAFVTTAGGAVLGGLVSGAFDGTARPFGIGIGVLAVAGAAFSITGARHISTR